MVYSTMKNIDNSSIGNVPMYVNIYRSESLTRTATSVAFNFGVCFTPVSQWTTNSVAASYGGVLKFASESNGSLKSEAGNTYHAHYDASDYQRQYTSVDTCFSFTKNTISANTTSVNVTIDVGWKNYDGTNLDSLTFNLPIPSMCGNGTISITDNYNNTFTISGTKGTAINNPTFGPNLKWSYDTDTSYANSATNGAAIDLNLFSSGDTRNVNASCNTTATYGAGTTVYTSLPIRRYFVASPGTPSVSISRLTMKKSWTFSWTAPPVISTYSPTLWYLIRLYKNGVQVPIYDSNGNQLSTEETGSTYYYRLNSACGSASITNPTATSIVIDPVKNGFAVGDTVQVSLFAGSKFGEYNTGGNVYSNTEIKSTVYTVRKAGSVRVKVGNDWKEGQVYVKVGNDWKEAETVYTKVGNDWKESV